MILTDRWNSRLHSFVYIHSNGKGFSLQKGQLRLLRGKLRLSDHMLHWKSWRSLPCRSSWSMRTMTSWKRQVLPCRQWPRLISSFPHKLQLCEFESLS